MSTPIRTYGWESSLKCKFDDCRNGSPGATEVALTPTESSPNNRERRAGFTLFGLFHAGFWEKSEGQSVLVVARRYPKYSRLT